jgi:hypothetical protein
MRKGAKIYFIVCGSICLSLVVLAVVIGVVYNPSIPSAQLQQINVTKFVVNYNPANPSQSSAQLDIQIFINVTNKNRLGLTIAEVYTAK